MTSARASAALAAALVSRAAAMLADGPALDDDPHRWRDAAVVAGVDAAWQRGDGGAVRALAEHYAALIELVPVRSGDAVELVPAGPAERRRRGSFATPRQLAAALAAHALPGTGPPDGGSLGIGSPGCSSPGTGSPDGGSLGIGSPGCSSPGAGGNGHERAPRLVDPGCGAGALLLAGLDRLLELGWSPRLAAEALHGVDEDPAAVAVCRTVLAVAATESGHPCKPEDFAGRIVVGNALLDPPPGAGFGWQQAFPRVLADPEQAPAPVTGWCGGFDVLLANPPWERLKVTRKDWNGAPPAQLRASRARAAAQVRSAGRHPLTGIGELNAYLPFAETCWRLLAPDGRAALVVPAGIASDRSAARLIEAWLTSGALERAHLLDTSEPLFPGVGRQVGVAVLVLRRGSQHPSPAAALPLPEVAVRVRDTRHPSPEQTWRLAPDVPRLVNPNTGTLPLFTGPTDARIVTSAHRRWPVLIRREAVTTRVLDDPWSLRMITPFHMTRDEPWFAAAPGPGLLPLWEAKHAALLDHRGGSAAHRYWVPEALVHERFGELTARGWLAGYRNVTTADAPRTLLPCALPVAGVGNSLPLLSAPRLPLLLAVLASLPVDHLVRQKHAGANLNFFKLEQVAVPAPAELDRPAPWDPGTSTADWLLTRFAAAVAWRGELPGLAVELAAGGIPLPVDGPAPAGEQARRLQALAELDAALALLLGLDRDDFAHVLSTFEALRVREERLSGEFGTARRALAAYDALREGTGARTESRTGEAGTACG